MMALSIKQEMTQWREFVNHQKPRWIKVKVMSADSLKALALYADKGQGPFNEQTYWHYVNEYVKYLNRRCQTGYDVLPDSIPFGRGVCGNLHYRPIYEAFWFSDYQYTGHMAGFFELGDNRYQTLILREKGTLLITFSKSRPNDFYCPVIHLVIQDGKYKK